MRDEQGLTIIELLLALSLIVIAFAALALSQVSNLQASTNSRVTTEVKAVAASQLEQAMSNVLRVITDSDAGWNATYQDEAISDDSGAVVERRSYYFMDYYYHCPTTVTPPATATRTTLRPTSDVPCTQSGTDGNISYTVSIVGQDGVLGEGVLVVTVTALPTSGSGATITMGDSITCYDVYPSPTASTPAPCPFPETTGGGR